MGDWTTPISAVGQVRSFATGRFQVRFCRMRTALLPILFLVSALASADPVPPSTDVVAVAYGTSYGECIGYCVQELHISGAPKIGCVPQTLLTWVKRHEVDNGMREGVTTADAQRMKELERENKELRRANEILKVASAFFAQAELDRRFKS